MKQERERERAFEPHIYLNAFLLSLTYSCTGNTNMSGRRRLSGYNSVFTSGKCSNKIVVS